MTVEDIRSQVDLCCSSPCCWPRAWLCSLGLGWSHLPSRLRVCLASPPSALLLFCKTSETSHPQNCSLRCGWAAESFLPVANRDRQLHNTQVLLLVNQANIESGLILSSHLSPHQVENQTNGRCLEHKQLQPNHIWLFSPATAKLCVCLMFWSCV